MQDAAGINREVVRKLISELILLRKDRKLTCSAVAERMQTCPAYIYRLEEGLIKSPKLISLERYANVFSKTIFYGIKDA